MSAESPRYGVLPDRLGAPAVRRLARVATQLGDSLCQRMVFVGASLLPIMETEDRVISSSRATDDVDAVTATATYSQKFQLEEALRARGFRNDASERSHLDRWHAPDGTIFDCVSCGDHTGGTGSQNDRWMIDNAIETELPPRVRHASAVGLLLLKVVAYADRGASSPIASKDLSDVATLFATRPELPNEVLNSAPEASSVIATHCRHFSESSRLVTAIRSHISSRRPLFVGVDDMVLARMREVADLSK